MTMETYFISDTHFGHGRILEYIGSDKKHVRSFPSVEDMDEYLVKQWNSVVRKSDRVYHLGDVAWNKASWLRVRDRLNGTKRLILGNHDSKMIREYAYDFQRVDLWRVFSEWGFTATHIPIRLASLRKGTIVNVHGHTHTDLLAEPHYKNVCVEQNDYTPFHLDQIRAFVKTVRENHGHPTRA